MIDVCDDAEVAYEVEGGVLGEGVEDASID